MERELIRASLFIVVICLFGCASHSSPNHQFVVVDPNRLPLEVIPGEFSWCKLTSDFEISKSLQQSADLLVLVKSPEGEFIVVSASSVPPGAECIERHLKAIRLVPTSNPIVGTIATITRTLASSGISVEVVTTGETDYFLFSTAQFERALEALRKEGHPVRTLN
jgi:hypothetical protein